MLRHTASKVRDSPGPLARNPRRGIGMWSWLLQIYAEIGDMVFDSDCQTDQIRKVLRELAEPVSGCFCSSVSKDN